MSKRFASVVLPLEIVKQQQFASKIQDINLNISSNVEYLKKFIEQSHQICYRRTKQINRLIISTQKKLNTENQQQQSFSDFANDLLEINQCLQSQINKDVIFMNSKKYDGIKRVNQMMSIKLKKAGENVSEFLALVRDYNSLGEIYMKKTQYFNNIEKNPINYYSFTKNQRKYQKILKIQNELQRKLQSITILKSEIRVMLIELSVKISQFYQNIRIKIEELRKISQVVRQKIVELIKIGKRFSKIEQASQGAEQSQIIENEKNGNSFTRIKNKTAQQNFTDYIKQLKKQQVSQNQRKQTFQSILVSFINNFLHEVSSIVADLEAIQFTKQYKKFNSQKAFMSNILPPRCIQDTYAILQQYNILKSIYSGIAQIVVKDVFESIFQRQKLYYYRFIQNLEQLNEKVQKNSSHPQSNLQQAMQIQNNHLQQKRQWNKQMGNKFKAILARIKNEYIKKSQGQIVNKADKKFDLFSQKSFQILKLDYFEHNRMIQPFLKSNYIINYQEIIKTDRLNKIILDIVINKNNSQQRRAFDQTAKSKSSCCGLFRKIPNKKSEKDNLLQVFKKSKQIQSYSCALKDNKYMLYQGKLTIYQDYLRFNSSFNPNTFFGSTDIFVPKHDIYQIIKGRHIMSLLISVLTKRGSIEFTSFFSDPFDILVETYMSNRNTQYQIITNANQIGNEARPQILLMKQKMQKLFIEMAVKQQFQIINIRSRDYENQIEIQYKYNDMKTRKNKERDNLKLVVPLLFKVIIRYYENSMEYVFWHSEQQTLMRKQKLQSLARSVINQNRIQKFDNIQREVQERKDANMDDNISFNISDQYSIIGPKEMHRLQIGNTSFNLNNSTQNKLDNNSSLAFPSAKNIQHSKMQMQGNQLFTDNSKGIIEEWISHKANKQDKLQDILDNLQSYKQIKEPEKNIIKLPKVDQQKKIIKIDQNMSLSFPMGQNKLQSINKTNSFSSLNNSKTISHNASTIKYSQKRASQRRSEEAQKLEEVPKLQVNNINRQIQIQGIKNVIILIAIAYSMISLLQFFI